MSTNSCCVLLLLWRLLSGTVILRCKPSLYLPQESRYSDGLIFHLILVLSSQPVSRRTMFNWLCLNLWHHIFKEHDLKTLISIAVYSSFSSRLIICSWQRCEGWSGESKTRIRETSWKVTAIIQARKIMRDWPRTVTVVMEKKEWAWEIFRHQDKRIWYLIRCRGWEQEKGDDDSPVFAWATK